MRAKYKKFGNDCVIYVRIICDENVFIKITSYSGWSELSPEIVTKVYDTNKEARIMFYNTCDECAKSGYERI